MDITYIIESLEVGKSDILHYKGKFYEIKRLDPKEIKGVNADVPTLRKPEDR